MNEFDKNLNDPINVINSPSIELNNYNNSTISLPESITMSTISSIVPSVTSYTTSSATSLTTSIVTSPVTSFDNISNNNTSDKPSNNLSNNISDKSPNMGPIISPIINIINNSSLSKIRNNNNSQLKKVSIQKNNIWSTSSVNEISDSPINTTNSVTTNIINNTNNNDNNDDNDEIKKIDHDNWRISMYSLSPKEFSNLPDKIEGTYKNDYNILKIHEIIMKRFQWEKAEKITTLKNQLIFDEEKLKERISMVDRKNLLLRIDDIHKKIQDIETGSRLKEYARRGLPYIREYKNIGSISHVISFDSNTKNDNEVILEDEEKQNKRHQIIRDYIEVARDYINIDLVREIPKGYRCDGCGNNIEDNEDDDSGIFVCPICNTERIAVIHTPFYKDSTRVSNIRNNYEDRENFLKVFQRYQGIQANVPPPELYRDIDLYFKKKNLPSCEEVRQMPLMENGRRGNTSKELMYMVLAETNNSTYYEDINLICHNCWGWDLVDLSHLEDKIMKDYDLTQKIYNEMPKIRKSSLNSQFRLFKLLLRYQNQIPYPIRSRDFKIPTTRDILEWHENIWKEIEYRAWGIKISK